MFAAFTVSYLTLLLRTPTVLDHPPGLTHPDDPYLSTLYRPCPEYTPSQASNSKWPSTPFAWHILILPHVHHRAALELATPDP